MIIDYQNSWKLMDGLLTDINVSHVCVFYDSPACGLKSFTI